MIDAPLFGLLHVWGQLLEAYHGVNGYGGTTAEVYGYHLQPRSPAAELGEVRRQAIVRRDEQSERALHALVQRFSEDYDCSIKVTGSAGHRWHITVTREG